VLSTCPKVSQFRDLDGNDAGSLLADAPEPEPSNEDGGARRDEGELLTV